LWNPTDDKDFVMSLMRKLTGGAVAMAMLSTAITPAMAQGGFYGGYNYGNGYGYGEGRHHRHHDRVDAGDVIGAIAIVGIIAAIASAGSKKSRNNDTVRRDRDGYPQQRQGSINSENEAVDACALAAEQRVGETASVREISTVEKSSDGWDVEGIVEQRDNWRDRNGDRKRFTCSVRSGSVDNIYVEDGKVAYR
jgi:hypothetical protein